MKIKLMRTRNNIIAWNNRNVGSIVTATQNVDHIDKYTVDFKENPHLIGIHPTWLTGSILKSECQVIDEAEKQCLFDKWFNKTISGLGSFDVALFNCYIAASGSNRERLEIAFPEKFSGTQVLK